MATDVIGERLGFGCASLYALPSPAGRRAVLEHAYRLGIRHFDVAPIYGLGRAEVELGRFAATHRDVRIATKFGLSLTAVGRLAGLVQRPIRTVLSRRPGLQDQMKDSGKGPDAGTVGGALYRSGDYSPEQTAAALRRSRRILGVERIDTFLAHEPAAVMTDSGALVAFLREQVQRGTIGSWGPAGELPAADADSTEFYRDAPVVQRPYDLGALGDTTGLVDVDVDAGADRQQVLFGFLSSVLPSLRAALTDDAVLRERCAAVLGRELTVAELPGILLRDAIRASHGGRVLVSTTKVENLSSLCEAAQKPADPGEAELRGVLRSALVGQGAAS